MAVATRDARGRTVSDQMMYNLNPSAIQSSIHLKTLNADGTNVYRGGLNSKIIFTIPHIPGGEYWDPAMSRFRCKFRLHVPVESDGSTITPSTTQARQFALKPAGIGANEAIPYYGHTTYMPPADTLSTVPIEDSERREQNQHVDGIRFERGPESMIRRIEIKDQSGQLIESLENYNLVYALSEICQDDPDTRQNRGSFFMENCYQDENALGAFLYPPQYVREFTPTSTTSAYRDFELCFNPISAVAGSGSTKMWPLSATNGLRIEITLEDPNGCLSYVPFHAAEDRINKVYGETSVNPSTNLPYFKNVVRTDTGTEAVDAREWTNAELLEAMNYKEYVVDATGQTPCLNFHPQATLLLRRYHTDNAANQEFGFGIDTRPFSLKTKQRTLPDSIVQKIYYEVIDPVYQMSTVIVPPAIDMQIRAQGQQLSPDGRIRLQTHSWQTFSTSIKWDETYLSYVIPVHVASLKSLFFTITPNDNAQNINADRTQFIMRKLKNYNFKLNGENILSSNARIEFPFSESVTEVMRAWSVGIKDQSQPTMLKLKNYGDNMYVTNNIISQPCDAVFGIDLESFSSKSNIMDSGINVRNSTIMFEGNFAAATSERDYVEWGERQTIQFYALYDMYVSIDPTSGMVSYEN
jgi:hypothetical protein